MFNYNSNSHSNTQYTTTSSSTEYITPIQNTQQPAPVQNTQLQYRIHNNQLQYRIHNSNTQYTTTNSSTKYTTTSSNTQYTTHRTAIATSNLYHLTNSHHNNYFYIKFVPKATVPTSNFCNPLNKSTTPNTHYQGNKNSRVYQIKKKIQ